MKMNKKYAIGVLVVICVAAAGWFGMRAVETRTENSVAEALAAVSAHAKGIHYSLLSNILTLNDVEYTLSDQGIVRRGSIANVEVKGFNRKYVFTKSDASYNADELPIVAESITATGITDSTQFSGTKAEQKVEKVQLKGWYQRLGTLITLHALHKDDVAFFEELYRCRIDGMEVFNVSMKLTDPDLPPVQFSVEKISLPEGMQAPRNGKKVSPVSVRFDGIRFSDRKFFGELQRLELRDILAPEPAVLVELFRLSREMNELDDDVRYFAGNKLISDGMALLLKNYEGKVPISRVLVEGGSLSVQKKAGTEDVKPAVLSLAVKSFDYRWAMTENGAFKDSKNVSGLKINFPDTMEEADILSRYAPEGLIFNMTSDGLMEDDRLSVKARYELEGLCVLEWDTAMVGNVREVWDVILKNSSPAELEKFMYSVRVKNMNVMYRDSGLLSMGVELVARRNSWSVNDTLNFVTASLQELTQVEERPVRELGKALLEQFSQPGELAMTFAPEKPMNSLEVISVASMNPDALPVTFSSKSGDKTLREYLSKN